MSTSTHYDTIIIGGGPGGLAAAYGLAKQQNVLVIEGDLWGGTCPNRGCDPKKMLYSAVEAKLQTVRMADQGVVGAVNIDWPALMKFKRSYTDTIPTGTEAGLKNSGIATVHGRATFQDDHTVTVAGTAYTADHFVLATGAHAAVLDIPGAQYLHTSDDFLDLDVLPSEIVFIGGGYVAIELANIAANAGATVHIIQHNHRILRGFPEEYTKRLVDIMTARGIHWHWDTTVTAVAEDGDRRTMALADGTSLTVDDVFCATGRPANVAGLGLDQIGIDTARGGIIVDSHLRTHHPHIYALGDAIDKTQPKLTPVSGFEGRYVAAQILGTDQAPIHYPDIPHTVFASPELSQVGVRLEDAQEAPDRYTIMDQDVSGWYTYNRIQDQSAHVTTITDKQSGLLVGAVVLAIDAEELINYFTALITQQTPASKLSQWIPVYPSVASDLPYFYA